MLFGSDQTTKPLLLYKMSDSKSGDMKCLSLLAVFHTDRNYLYTHSAATLHAIYSDDVAGNIDNVLLS